MLKVIQLCVLTYLLCFGYSLTNAQLFFLSDATLFQMGIDQLHNASANDLGACVISNLSAACTHYAKIRHPDGTTSGLPDMIGTGCLNGCWGPPNIYYNYQNTPTPICSGNVVSDGANMMRIGLLKGYCGKTNNTSNIPVTNNTTNTSNCTNSASITETKIQYKFVQSNTYPLWFPPTIIVISGLTLLIVILDKLKKCCKTEQQNTSDESKQNILQSKQTKGSRKSNPYIVY